MTCEELRGEWELHGLGLSEADIRGEAEQHLHRGCSVCTPRFRHALAFNTELLAIAEMAAPSKNLRDRVLLSAGGTGRAWGWIAGWGAAAACLVGGLVWSQLRAGHSRSELAAAQRALEQSASDLAAVRGAISLLSLPDTRQVILAEGAPAPPRGRLFVNAARGVLLLAGNLAQLDSGRTYQLWILPKSGAPRPAGLFRPDTNGRAMLLSEAPIQPDAAAVAVTVEPRSGSPAPTSAPFLVTPLAE